jgi:signal transduction histidine kinase
MRMKSIQSPVRRFVKHLLLIVSALFVLNVLFLGLYVYYYSYKKSLSEEVLPIPLLKQLSGALVSEKGGFELGAAAEDQLRSQHLWAMLIDDKQGTILWSYHLPNELPKTYSLTDVALLSRYYIKDYPVFVWKHPKGLIVVGYPKGSITKVMGVLPLSEVHVLPWRIVFVVLCDVFILLLIYFLVDRKTLNKVTNILSGIQSLANGKLIKLEEKGSFSEIAVQLNRTSDLLETRSNAQENWIAGVSHDVRTPLSVILGYAEQIERNESLPEDVRAKAASMKFEGVRLRDLVDDLNLVTRLGNSEVHIKQERFHPAVFSRNLLAGFLDQVSNEKYPVDIDLDKRVETVYLIGDPHLLQRALNNLLYNSVKHNPAGCEIRFGLRLDGDKVVFLVSDNGNGVTEEELAKWRNRAHYLSSDQVGLLQQHGLGLYIVRQIVGLFGGEVVFCNGQTGGFEVSLVLPVSG